MINQDVAKFIGRPVICIPEGKRELIVGFAESSAAESEGNIVVLDYVTNAHVEVNRHRVMLFTRQRFDAIFLIDRNSLFSLLFVPFREITFDEKYDFNQEHCNCHLEVNGFWLRYSKYLKGE